MKRSSLGGLSRRLVSGTDAEPGCRILVAYPIMGAFYLWNLWHGFRHASVFDRDHGAFTVLPLVAYLIGLGGSMWFFL